MRKRCLKILFILILIIILVYNNAFANAGYANWGMVNDVKDGSGASEDLDPAGNGTGNDNFFAIEIYPGKISKGSGILAQRRGNALDETNIVNISDIYSNLVDGRGDYSNENNNSEKPKFRRSRIFLDVSSNWAEARYRAPTLVIDKNIDIDNGYTAFDYGLSDSRYGSDPKFNGNKDKDGNKYEDRTADYCNSDLCMATIQINSGATLTTYAENSWGNSNDFNFGFFYHGEINIQNNGRLILDDNVRSLFLVNLEGSESTVDINTSRLKLTSDATSINSNYDDSDYNDKDRKTAGFWEVKVSTDDWYQTGTGRTQYELSPTFVGSCGTNCSVGTKGGTINLNNSLDIQNNNTQRVKFMGNLDINLKDGSLRFGSGTIADIRNININDSLSNIQIMGNSTNKTIVYGDDTNIHNANITVSGKQLYGSNSNYTKYVNIEQINANGSNTIYLSNVMSPKGIQFNNVNLIISNSSLYFMQNQKNLGNTLTATNIYMYGNSALMLEKNNYYAMNSTIDGRDGLIYIGDYDYNAYDNSTKRVITTFANVNNLAIETGGSLSVNTKLEGKSLFIGGILNIWDSTPSAGNTLIFNEITILNNDVDINDYDYNGANRKLYITGNNNKLNIDTTLYKTGAKNLNIGEKVGDKINALGEVNILSGKELVVAADTYAREINLDEGGTLTIAHQNIIGATIKGADISNSNYHNIINNMNNNNVQQNTDYNNLTINVINRNLNGNSIVGNTTVCGKYDLYCNGDNIVGTGTVNVQTDLLKVNQYDTTFGTKDAQIYKLYLQTDYNLDLVNDAYIDFVEVAGSLNLNDKNLDYDTIQLDLNYFVYQNGERKLNGSGDIIDNTGKRFEYVGTNHRLIINADHYDKDIVMGKEDNHLGKLEINQNKMLTINSGTDNNHRMMYVNNAELESNAILNINKYVEFIGVIEGDSEGHGIVNLIDTNYSYDTTFGRTSATDDAAKKSLAEINIINTTGLKNTSSLLVKGTANYGGQKLMASNVVNVANNSSLIFEEYVNAVINNVILDQTANFDIVNTNAGISDTGSQGIMLTGTIIGRENNYGTLNIKDEYIFQATKYGSNGNAIGRVNFTPKEYQNILRFYDPSFIHTINLHGTLQINDEKTNMLNYNTIILNKNEILVYDLQIEENGTETGRKVFDFVGNDHSVRIRDGYMQRNVNFGYNNKYLGQFSAENQGLVVFRYDVDEQNNISRGEYYINNLYLNTNDAGVIDSDSIVMNPTNISKVNINNITASDIVKTDIATEIFRLDKNTQLITNSASLSKDRDRSFIFVASNDKQYNSLVNWADSFFFNNYNKIINDDNTADFVSLLEHDKILVEIDETKKYRLRDNIVSSIAGDDQHDDDVEDYSSAVIEYSDINTIFYKFKLEQETNLNNLNLIVTNRDIERKLLPDTTISDATYITAHAIDDWMKDPYRNAIARPLIRSLQETETKPNFWSAMTEITPDVTGLNLHIPIQATLNAINNIDKRLSYFRLLRFTSTTHLHNIRSLSQKNIKYYEDYYDKPFNEHNLWAEAFVGALHQDNLDRIFGYDMNYYGGTIGYDVKADIREVLGMSYTFTLVDAEDLNPVKENKDEMTAIAHNIDLYYMIYGKWNYLSLNIGGNITQYMQKRNIHIESFDEVAEADWLGYSYYANAEYGLNILLLEYGQERTKNRLEIVNGGNEKSMKAIKENTANNYRLGTTNNFVMFTPRLSLRYSGIIMNEYEEEGAGAANLAVAIDNFSTLDASIGATLTFSNLITNDVTLQTSLIGNLSYMIQNNRVELTARFIESDIEFDVYGFKQPDELSYDLGIMFNFVFLDRMEVGVNFVYTAAESYNGFFGRLLFLSSF